MKVDGLNNKDVDSLHPTSMAENTGQGETPPVKPNDDKTKMAGKEKAIKGTRPDPTKKILLMEWNKRLDPNAPDTYSEIDIDMEDDIDEDNLPVIPKDVADRAIEANKKPS